MDSGIDSKNTNFMYVIKRDGRKERVSFDKILRRIEILCERTKLDRINTIEIAKETINGLYDGITTEEIDHFAAVNCAEKIRNDPQYDRLATALCISRLHKMTSKYFIEVTQKLYDNKDKFGKSNPLVTDEYLEFVKNNIERIQEALDFMKDYDFDYFGFKTLEKAYLHRILGNNTVLPKNETNVTKKEVPKNKPDIKKEDAIKEQKGYIVERPQHLWMRVAIGLNLNNIDNAIETYKSLSDRKFIFGSPTLYNAGSKTPQLSSCFLLYMPDSIEGIYDTIKDTALISKRAGGIGISMSDIRASGSTIRGTNGVTNGPVPFIQELNWTGRAVNQGSRRAGAIAIYIEPWHADIFHFCELRSNKKKEEECARDIFMALWIPDLFMKRVQTDGIWSLMCPDECPGLTTSYGESFEKLYEQYEKEGRYKKQVRAKDLWFHILTQQVENGMPYMLYKDNINRQSNQKNLGVIKSSNLN
ncbi:ribonucleoside diphosphate reductase large subunit [Klosneuvirus KNV1]|uniref:Ribonucleoside-diphosphate reductase n=1 Tax=Klosneuvirus KNV1 TaxID=1977640 RepID=A0A1V0SJL3_9VIRU|nr:ribonucleoside diphosphate reductase large subunit [Klosneuvirus KNV1]